MHRRPVVGVGRDDDDVAVQAQLLAVVLADVRVVPVDARVGERDARRVAPADRHGVLGLVRAVVAVLQPQPVPVHGRLHVALVLDVDERPPSPGGPAASGRDGAVVGEHPHRRVADALGHRRDAQREPVAVGELDDRGGGRCRQARRLARELVGRSGHPVSLLVSGAAQPRQPSTALEDARDGVRRGRWSGTRAPCRPYARPSRDARRPRTRLGDVRLRRQARGRCRAVHGLRDRAEDGGDQRGPRRSVAVTRPARSSPLAAWMSAISIDRCQAAGTSARKVPSAWPRSMSGEQRGEHRAVAVAQLLVRAACRC